MLFLQRFYLKTIVKKTVKNVWFLSVNSPELICSRVSRVSAMVSARFSVN